MTLASPEPSIGSLIRRHRLGLVVSALVAVIASACSLAPYVAVFAVTTVLFDPAGPRPGLIAPIAALTAVALVVRAVAQAVATHVGHVTAYRTLRELRLVLVERLHRLPLGRVQARSAGELRKVLHDDVEQLEEALAHGVPDGAAAAAVPMATTVVLFAIDWRLALVALASLVLLVVISAIGMTMAQRSNIALSEHAGVLARTVMAYLSGIKVIRGFLRHDSGYDQARGAVVTGIRLQDSSTRGPLRWLVAAMSVATGLAVALLVPIAGWQFLSGGIGLATLVLFLLLALGYLSPIIGLVGTLATILTRIQFAAGSINALLDEPVLPEPVHSRVPDDSGVVFDQVEFAYREGEPVLHRVSLAVPHGSTVALVGATGSGKSTLARLLARFADVTGGEIRIGGVDVRQIASTELARTVAFVQQDEYVFDATLVENIRIARPDATDDEVIAAATSAQLGDVAARLPDGWQTALPAGGAALSGGERQRIAVARALLKRARVIVLDEATASLDATTEQQTLRAIEELSRGRTVIAIAHRLSTITTSDLIAVVNEGKIIASGTHDHLSATCTTYQDLWQAYERAEGWRLTPRQGSGNGNGNGTSSGNGPPRQGSRTSEDDVVTPGLASMGFARQWRTMYGRSWTPLVRDGLVRLVAESLVRGAPLVAVLAITLAAVGVAPWTMSATTVWLVTGLLGLALVVRLMTSVWANSLVWRLAAQSTGDLQLSVLDRLLRVPLGFFQRVDNGRTATLVTNDLAMVDFQNVPQQVAAAVVQPLYSLVVLTVIDWRLAIAALIGLPLFWLLTGCTDRIHRRVFADVHAARAEATTAMVEQARGAAVLRANPDSAMALRYHDSIDGLARASIAMSVKAVPANAAGSIALESGQVVVILVGSWLYGTGTLPAATLLIFLVLTLALYQPIQELAILAGYRRNQQQIAARLGEVWDAPVLPEPSQPRTPTDATVEFDRVTFHYDNALEPALDEVSFRAEEGTITALVGRSGSGKSTIAHLVSRRWDAESGVVRIGDVAITEIGTAGVLDAVATVDQDTYLFDQSVRDNLTLGRPDLVAVADGALGAADSRRDAADAVIWQALRAAHCDDVVAGLPDGLDTVLRDGGSDLSGGQRQRLAIARALLKDSPVLVLDESVASVDPGTEDRIQQSLAELASGRTVIVVAHRLRTVVNVDRIVVVDQGRIAGIGRHHDLVDSCPAYRRLAISQGLIAEAAPTDHLDEGQLV